MSPSGPYRDPDATERQAAHRAARSLLAAADTTDATDRLFADLGFEARHGIDPTTGRECSIYLASGSDSRTWGAVLADRSAAPRTVIEVPHPGFDINTEKLGLALHRRVPGSVLLVAGAHRQAADGAADVAHNNRSLFHSLAVALAESGLDEIQLHGFANRNLPTSDVVVSTGSAPTNQLARRIADGLSDLGLRTCRAWVRRCGQLEGRTNQQGRAAAAAGSVFVHLELSWSIRRDATSGDQVVATLAERLAEG
ncbi:hypothetical protein E0H26_25700 [Micromonospora zingiberis]|uniref:Uncharacterized protein n=1 Tax=Micromonospora zingiberis TaxID=2053011 RepID=A0A4R0G5F5_9ACTN|nr:hypothetical protein E0H26_25700 [Micromonospora zingiberis]